MQPWTMKFTDVMATFNDAYARLWVIVLTALIIGYVYNRWRNKGVAPRHTHEQQTVTVQDIRSNNPYASWRWIFAIALLLRVPYLFRSLWYDEAFTAAMANTQTLNDFGKALVSDVHPPLHYLTVKLPVTFFGDGEIILRLPSLVAGLALIYVVYRLALALTKDINVAFISAWLVVILPALVYYSAEARYPMMLALAVCIAALAMLEDKPKLLAASLICIPLLHATGMIYAGVLLLLCIVYQRHWLRIYCVVMPVIIAAGALMLSQSRDVANGFWLPEVHPTWHLIDMTVTQKTGNPAVAMLIMITIMSITVISLWVSRRWIISAKGVVALVIMGVPAILWVIGILWHPIYLQRTVIASAIPIIICWAYALPRLNVFATYALRAAIVVSAATASHSYLIGTQPSIREVFQRGCNGAEYVYATTTHMAINALYYAPAPLKVWVNGDSVAQELSKDAKTALGMSLVRGINDIPRGEYCLLVMYEANTRTIEIAFVNYIIEADDNFILSDKWIPVSPLMSYRIVRFQHE